MHYAVKAFFEHHPDVNTVYETYDGVLHPTEEMAKEWIKFHANRNVVRYDRPKSLAKSAGEENTKKSKTKDKEPKKADESSKSAAPADNQQGDQEKTTDAAAASTGAAPSPAPEQ